MKKTICAFLVASGIFVYASCKNADARYINLDTGEKVKLVKDETSGLMVTAETKQPVHIYVDTKTNDTIYGKTGLIINGHVYKNETGSYYYEEEIKTEATGDYKKKIDADGDVKIKTDDQKIKIEDGVKKVKND